MSEKQQTSPSGQKAIVAISFIELINDFRIQIPIIQRDYAQGRGDSETIKKRIKFIDFIFTILSDSKNSCTLDFVYGETIDSVDSKSEKGLFSPLDGQQRLTTLFLLHWYIAVKGGEIVRMKELFSKSFTYETRVSSREFCEELIDKCDNLYNPPRESECSTKISKCITKSAWFVLSWKKDPTVQAMLRMLDTIETEFLKRSKAAEEIWRRLVGDKAITFINIPLHDFGLSDDLYIKMNARGKPLTNFENWKAEFEKFINKEKFEIFINEKGMEECISLKNSFAFKIDTVWTDLFWGILDKDKDKDNMIAAEEIDKMDTYMLNFIYSVHANWYCLNKGEAEIKEFGDVISKISEIDSFYKDLDKVKGKESFINLIEVFNIWHKVWHEEGHEEGNEEGNIENFKCSVTLWPKKLNENSIFEQFCKTAPSSLTYVQRVLFYAQTLLLEKNIALDTVDGKNWVRVVRNLVENEEINTPNIFAKCLKHIESISECLNIDKKPSGSQNIYDYLNFEGYEEIPKFNWAKSQMNEEIAKANIITTPIDNKDVKAMLILAEDNIHLRGNICCLLNYDAMFKAKALEFQENKDLNDTTSLLAKVKLNDYSFNLEDFKRLYISYDILSKNDFRDIWGDLINTDIYVENAESVRLQDYHTKTPLKNYICKKIDFIKLVDEKSKLENFELNHEVFIIKIAKDFIDSLKPLVNKVFTKKEMLYCYHIYSSQINKIGGKKSIFSRNVYNFFWVGTQEGYSSYFGDHIYQNYNRNIRRLFNPSRAIWLEKEDKGRPTKLDFFAALGLVYWFDFENWLLSDSILLLLSLKALKTPLIFKMEVEPTLENQVLVNYRYSLLCGELLK